MCRYWQLNFQDTIPSFVRNWLPSLPCDGSIASVRVLQQRDLLLPLSISSILVSFIQQLLTSSFSSSHRSCLSIYVSFNILFPDAVSRQDVDHMSVFLHFILGSTYLSSLNLCNTSSFFTRVFKLVSLCEYWRKTL